MLSSLWCAGCLEGIPFFGPAAVYPRIVPVTTETVVVPPTYVFAFQDRNVVVGCPIDASVYAGARAADKSARIYDNAIGEQEWRQGIYQVLIMDPAQDGFYEDVLGRLRAERDTHQLDQDEYAELLAVFVQSIPYENQNLTSPRFPIETYVDGMGDCDDKSLLLAGLLSREGYQTALLYFEPERHMSVGIGCRDDGYRATGYAYIETTNVTLVGIPPEKLAGDVQLASHPVVIPVGDGDANYTLCQQTAALWEQKKKTERELALIETAIRAREAALTEMKAALDAQRSSMDQMLSRGDDRGYNSRGAAYNIQVGEYNEMRAALMEEADRFNRLAETHNYIITHQHDRKGTYAWFSSLPEL